jgi:type VI secretion system protein VasJ
MDDALIALGTTPIPGDAPTGIAARYEPAYEEMQAEIDKLSAIDAGSPNWSTVAEHATALLGATTKDLLVAAYLGAARWEQRGWTGLAEGLALLHGLLSTFPEGLYPAKSRARRTAVDWFLDRVRPLVEAAPVTPADRAALVAAGATIDQLVAWGEGKWDGDPVAWWSLGRILTGKLGELPAAVTAVATDAAPAAAPAAGTATVAAAGGALVPPSFASAGSRAEAYRLIAQLAEQLAVAEPHSPVPYLLRRCAAWGAMPLPQLFADLQRSGTVWDLALQAPGPLADAGLPPIAPTPAPAPTAPVSAPAPAAAPAEEPPAPAPRRPRGDY